MTDAPDTRAASVVTDHPFEPRLLPDRRELVDFNGDPMGGVSFPPNPHLCQVCRLGEAAHLDTTVTREEKR